MTQEKIEKQIKVYIYQVLEAIKIGKKVDNENPKLDFKRKWYNLKDLKEINEFLKDTTAIANTVGLDGYIVFGFDDKTGEFHDSYFENSTLRDTADLNGIIIKRCSNLFDIAAYPIEIDGHKLSVLYIAPTLEKPIAIINYQKFDKEGNLKTEEQQRIFVRKGTSAFVASKYDLEMMFYDRKNIQPDYDLELDIVQIFFRQNTYHSPNTFQLFMSFNYENLGRKSISIHSMKLIVKTASFLSETEKYAGGFIWTKGDIKRMDNYEFIIEHEQARDFAFEVLNRTELELSLWIDMSNGKQLFKTFDFTPPYSK